ncbi:methionine ABC transporter permease [Haploplasma axanthum]|uniref:D-methionine transport system permease protein metI n=1 Tax=Haploplasma axanthum TaxID=29552 RepID=A0A449BE85_HAPAX|nr:ABC transporter permease subunit [Haploplasma axanthum]VEU80745.1 D-methionine transport system permease protein metI [Haploplasma axanthum]
MKIFIETWKDFNPIIFKGLLETLDMVTTSLIIATLIGIPIGIYFSLSSSKKNIWYIITSFTVNTVRSIPFLIFIVLVMPLSYLLIGTSFGTHASKIPLTIIGISLITRSVEQSIQNLSPELILTSRILGATKTQAVFYFIIKEALPNLILGITSVSISLISYSTIMGVVAGGGLGDIAIRYGFQEYNRPLLIIVLIIMVILVQIIQFTGNYIAYQFDKKRY